MSIDGDPKILDPREQAANEMTARKFRHGDFVRVQVPEKDGVPSHLEDGWEFGIEEPDGTVLVRKRSSQGVYGEQAHVNKEDLISWQVGESSTRAPEMPDAQETATSEFTPGQEVRVLRFGKDGNPNYMQRGWKVASLEPDGMILVELDSTDEGTPEKLVDQETLQSWQNVERDAENLNPKKQTTEVATPAVAEQNVGEQLAAQFVTGQKVRVLRSGATEPEEGWRVAQIHRDANPVKVTVFDESGTKDKTVNIEDLVSWQKN